MGITGATRQSGTRKLGHPGAHLRQERHRGRVTVEMISSFAP
jgi:hypothetical protein